MPHMGLSKKENDSLIEIKNSRILVLGPSFRDSKDIFRTFFLSRQRFLGNKMAAVALALTSIEFISSRKEQSGFPA